MIDFFTRLWFNNAQSIQNYLGKTSETNFGFGVNISSKILVCKEIYVPLIGIFMHASYHNVPNFIISLTFVAPHKSHKWHQRWMKKTNNDEFDDLDILHIY